MTYLAYMTYIAHGLFPVFSFQFMLYRMMTINDLLKEPTIDRREAELLLAYLLDKNRTHIKAHSEDEVDAKIVKKFLALLSRREKHEPIAYLIGNQPFFGREFAVNRHTLIPRPETETLVELVRAEVRSTKYGARGTKSDVLRTAYSVPLTIIDLGTGSGCLAVTLALECPSAMVIASDISSNALKVARKNAKQLGASVTFVRENLLGKKLAEAVTRNAKRETSNPPALRVTRYMLCDLIFVANLPYLPSTDKKTMIPDVAKFEPHKALFAGRDGTSLVVKLLEQIRHSAKRTFSEAGIRYSIFLELDPRQTKKLASFARKLFPKHKVAIKSDLYGRERFLTIT